MIRRKKHDKRQTRLVEPEPTFTVKIEPAPMEKFCCPFCLYEGWRYEFEVKMKKGYSLKRAKCPDCGQGMKMDTLTKPMSPVELAQFLYDYMAYGGYEKISWDKLKMRLKSMGIASTFWTAWYKAKDEAYKSKYGMTYEEYVEAEGFTEGF